MSGSRKLPSRVFALAVLGGILIHGLVAVIAFSWDFDVSNNSRSLIWWAPYAAALWALIFAVFHVIWAAGWYVGLDAEQARIAFAKTPFLVYDLVVAGICAFAVPLALALGMPWGRHFPRRLIGLFAWVGTVLLVLRSLASIIQGAYLIASGQLRVESWGLWELWFYLGAILFSVSTWRFWRDRGTRVS